MRELRNVVERAMILASGSILRISLPERRDREAAVESLAEAERRHILATLEKKEETRDLISPWISLAGRALGRIRPLLEAGPESSARRACEQLSLLVSLRNLLSYP